MNKQQRDELARLKVLLAKRRSEAPERPRWSSTSAPEVLTAKPEGQLSLLGKEAAC